MTLSRYSDVFVRYVILVAVITQHSAVTTATCAGDNIRECWCSHYGGLGMHCTGITDISAYDEVPTFGEFDGLHEEVYLTNMNIKRIQPFILTGVRTLKLAIIDARIESIAPQAFWLNSTVNSTSHDEMLRLSLMQTKIRHIAAGTFDPLVNLVYLCLHGNRLLEIADSLVINLRRLNALDVSANDLHALPDRWLPAELTTLHFSENEIAGLTRNTFDGAGKLARLRLTPGTVSLSEGALAELPELNRIEVSEMVDCTCDYLWYLEIRVQSVVCQRRVDYDSIRQYLRQECSTNHTQEIN